MINRFLACLALAGLLQACTLPRYQLAKEERHPPQLTDSTLIAGDGVELPLRRWLPEGSPKALIVALHGFNDYSNAFAQPAEYFKQHGIALLAYDQRGFGDTKRRGIWGGQENLTRDLSDAVQAASLAYPSIPIYVLGESMGGAVALAAINTPEFPHQKVRGLILSSPALWGGAAFNPFYRFLLWVTAHNFPQMQLTGRGLKIQASDNIKMLQALGRDPRVIKKTRIDAVYGLVQMMDEALLELPAVRTPILFLYGQHDQVIPRGAIREALRRIEQPVTFAYYDTGWHMLLRDLQAERVLRDIVAWIENPQRPLPSAAVVEPGEFIGETRRATLPHRKRWPEGVACARPIVYKE